MFFTEAASAIGRESDDMSFVITLVCVLLLCVITALMLYFAYRYGRARHPEAAAIHGSFVLEAGWTTSAIVIVLAMFALGWGVYASVKGGPPEAYEIKARARMWSWSFEYPDGRVSNELMLAEGRTVKLTLTSDDVIHSLYVPAFRVKQDAVPGAINTIWFTPDRQGTYDLFCAEYCGYGHSDMLTKAVVMGEEEFSKWGFEDKAATGTGPAGGLAERGEGLVQSKGCAGCHSVDGSARVGPSLKSIFGHRVVVSTDGEKRELVIDEAYVKRSIEEPGADVVEGYPAVMPVLGLTEGEIEAVAAYIKTLR